MTYHASVSLFGYTVTQNANYLACLLLIVLLMIPYTVFIFKAKNPIHVHIAAIATGIIYLVIAMTIGILQITIT